MSRSLAQSLPGHWWVEVALGMALTALVAGLTLPFLAVERFFIFTEEFSVLEAVVALHEEGETLVALAILLFSVVFPLLKILLSFQLWRLTPVNEPDFHARALRLETVGKWSMLDVFVAALVVFSVKASAIADATTRPGLYLFLAAVLVSMGTLAWIRRAARAAEEGAKPPPSPSA